MRRQSDIRARSTSALKGLSHSPAGTTDNLTVTAELQGLRASKNVYDFDGWSALLSFFEELALNWRGWDGDKTFDSLEVLARLSSPSRAEQLLPAHQYPRMPVRNGRGRRARSSSGVR
jgi:hypothetical protein